MSSKGFIMGGSGGAPLNFKVVGGTEQPTSPKENTIWVNTSDKITSWVISAVEPDAPQEGMVWIVYASNSTASFDILKTNSIIVAIASTVQYNGETWESKNTKVFQGGQWLSLEVTLIDEGVVADGTDWSLSGYASKGTSGNYLTLATTNPSEWSFTGYFYTLEPIDLTNFRTIELTGYGTRFNLYVGTKATESSASVSCDANSESKKVLDVSSLTGKYYVGLSVYGSRGQNSALYTGYAYVRTLRLLP